MENEIMNDVESYGVETDDWMMEETRKEFISFKNQPGQIVVIFTGKPTKQRSKFSKDQFWFPCLELIDMEKGLVEERILSTASNQLRKKLTKLQQKYPDRLFCGKMPVVIDWEGEGMSRYYSVGPLADGSAHALMEKLDLPSY